MYQLTLDVRPRIPLVLENFVVGDNAAIMAALQRQSQAHDGSGLYLWGMPCSGRTHLLQAITTLAHGEGRPARHLAAKEAESLQLMPDELIALDDVDQMNPPTQAALFRALIQAPALRAGLILTGNAPPQLLALREDVRTRIGQMLVFQIQPLDDAGKGALLIQHASARGFALDAEIVEYLLRHGPRDMRWLMGMLDALDEASLTQQRHVTLPLLREIQHEDCEPELPF